MRVEEVSYTVTPSHSSWGNRFRLINDRGRVIVLKFLITLDKPLKSSYATVRQVVKTLLRERSTGDHYRRLRILYVRFRQEDVFHHNYQQLW